VIEDLRKLEEDALAAVLAARDQRELEDVRIRFLGRREGGVSLLLRRLGGLDPDQRPAAGAEANRKLRENSVSVNGAKHREMSYEVPDGVSELVLKLGKKWARVLLPS